MGEVCGGDEGGCICKRKGKDGVNVEIRKGQDGKSVEVGKDRKKEIDEFIKENGKMVGRKVMDRGKGIEDGLYRMIEKAAPGTIVGMMVIPLSLTNITTTPISILSIPISILIPILPFKLSHLSFNILTLAPLTL
ncbi:efflux RND transporter permease subunit, partial [Staphylococcus saprophyticus]|uniref:efflux RND transporter permease subunit n=1 Tax=Staphylococcus saprophyticus TaxID=29385 RepID=UPI001CD9C0C4